MSHCATRGPTRPLSTLSFSEQIRDGDAVAATTVAAVSIFPDAGVISST